MRDQNVVRVMCTIRAATLAHAQVQECTNALSENATTIKTFKELLPIRLTKSARRTTPR